MIELALKLASPMPRAAIGHLGWLRGAVGAALAIALAAVQGCPAGGVLCHKARDAPAPVLARSLPEA